MEQIIEIPIKNNITEDASSLSIDKSKKSKTKFDEEWEKAIPVDKAFDELLTYVRSLWKK